MEYGLIFDMDGVVIDSNPYHKTAWENFLRKKGIPFDDQFFFNVLSGRTGPTSMKIIFGDDLSETNLNEYLDEVDQGFQNILRQTEEVKPIAGLYEFLDSIPGNGHRLALATSAPPLNIELGLEKLKLEGVFEVIVGKVDVVHGKPDPEVYLTTVERLGLPIEQCIVFEDSIVGIQSARKAGIHVVGIASGHSKEELLEEGVSLVVNDFTDLSLEQVTSLIR
ncbi:MAG: HAD family phosphatase [Bacteroidales bacterium]|nr:HAD family phosphatase [Bacteroidales bacterium]